MITVLSQLFQGFWDFCLQISDSMKKHSKMIISKNFYYSDQLIVSYGSNFFFNFQVYHQPFVALD